MTKTQGTATIEKAEERYLGHGLATIGHRTIWVTEFHGGNLDGRRNVSRTRREAREDAELFGYEWR